MPELQVRRENKNPPGNLRLALVPRSSDAGVETQMLDTRSHFESFRTLAQVKEDYLEKAIQARSDAEIVDMTSNVPQDFLDKFPHLRDVPKSVSNRRKYLKAVISRMKKGERMKNEERMKKEENEERVKNEERMENSSNYALWS
jgi:hypothetical protein